MRDLLLIAAAAALLIVASVAVTQWASNNISTDEAYDVVSKAFFAGNVTFFAVLGALANQRGLRARRAGLVAVAVTAVSYSGAVPILLSLVPRTGHVVLPGGVVMQSYMVAEPVAVAAFAVVVALLAFVFATSTAWLWSRVRPRTV